MPERSIYTAAVHAGERLVTHRPVAPGATPFVALSTPVYNSVSYTYEDSEALDAALGGESSGPVYQRYGNPTVAALESAVTELEGGEAGQAYGSGMAAIHAALLGAGVRAGTAVVAAQDVYGATYSLLSKLLAGQGVTVTFVDTADLDAVGNAMAATRPVALLVETVSNPLVKVADVPRLAELAHRYGATLIVDNTFATPLLCRPLTVGADYAVHSATKYLGGHGDVLGGVVVTSGSRRRALNELNKLLGANLGPQEAWLIHRGIKTLPLRMARQCDNALAVARWLETHPAVARVYYPGLATHPQYDLAASLFDGRFGAITSFELRDGGRPEVFRFMEALRLVQAGTTLGDVYSLVLYPAMASHRALDPDLRRAIGIGDGLVRFSAGIEDVTDILADLDGALSAI